MSAYNLNYFGGAGWAEVGAKAKELKVPGLPRQLNEIQFQTQTDEEEEEEESQWTQASGRVLARYWINNGFYFHCQKKKKIIERGNIPKQNDLW